MVSGSIKQEEFLVVDNHSSSGNDIDYITIASEGNGIDFGDLTQIGYEKEVVCTLSFNKRYYLQQDIRITK